MSQPGSDEEGKRKRDKVGDFLKKNLTKGELAFKHALGLGQTPNVVPVTRPVLDGPPRVVEVGWHPVGGLAGKWFAEETGLGKMITEKINKYPDPTQHWAVLVGDFAHQLWMDEDFHVIYTNERYKREEWRTFTVGETRFNDDAIRRTGEYVIQSIRSRQPVYNLISNNCQTYVLELLDAVKVDGHKDFGTTLAVYDKIFSSGKVMDLFSSEQEQQQVPMIEAPPSHPQYAYPPQQPQYALPPPPPHPPGPHPGTVSHAQQVMNDNTTQLDTQEEASKPRGVKEPKRSFFSRFSRKDR
ncbi:hypothetical protein EsH8_VI_001126 [Colletotrichum jinshuiense]